MKKVYLITLLLLIPLTAFSGKLDDFERDLKESREQEREADDYDDSTEDSCASGCAQIFFEAFFQALFSPDSYTEEEDYYDDWEEPETEEEVETIEIDFSAQMLQRESGDPIQPIVRASVDYQILEYDINSLRETLELGIGPIAFKYQGRIFLERPMMDSIYIHSLAGVFRFVTSPGLEFGFGGGAFFYMGNTTYNTGMLTMPIRFYPAENWGLEFTPNIIMETEEFPSVFEGDLVAVWKVDNFSLRAGFGWYGREDNFLSGPLLGIVFQQ